MPNQITDPLLLQAVLIGLQQMRTDLDDKVSDIRRRLGVRAESGASQPSPAKSVRKKRKLSAAGRANIVAAQKKRWAERHKQQEQSRNTAKTEMRAKSGRASAKRASAVKSSPAKKAAARKAASPAKAKRTKKPVAPKTAPAATPEQTPELT